MRGFEIIDLKDYELLKKLDNVQKIIIKHNRDGNYTDIIFIVYEDKDIVRQYRITMNANSGVMII